MTKGRTKLVVASIPKPQNLSPPGDKTPPCHASGIVMKSDVQACSWTADVPNIYRIEADSEINQIL